MNSFVSSGLKPEIISAITELGFVMPLPIQEKVIPVVLESDSDIVALAQTGTGKTAAFGLPLLSQLDISGYNPRVLVLSPTRELCLQITAEFKKYSKYLPQIKVCAAYGGASIVTQMRELKEGAHVVVATPGRLLDLIRRNRVNLSQVASVVLDEADEMLNMGFKEDLTSILTAVPSQRRTLLFSATMPPDVARIAAGYMRDPVELSSGTINTGNADISHVYHLILPKDRYRALKRIVDHNPGIYAIIFCRTKKETAEISDSLVRDGYNADALHGDLSQVQRDSVMNRFRGRNIDLLVATDVAARGIDMNGLSHVINYNLPDEIAAYTHRSGRTGRAGKKGTCVSIITKNEQGKIARLTKIVNCTFEKKPVPGYREIMNEHLSFYADKILSHEVHDIPEIGEVEQKLASLSKKDLITRLLSLELQHILMYYKKEQPIEEPRDMQKQKYRSESARPAYHSAKKYGGEASRSERYAKSEKMSGESSNSGRYGKTEKRAGEGTQSGAGRFSKKSNDGAYSDRFAKGQKPKAGEGKFDAKKGPVKKGGY